MSCDSLTECRTHKCGIIPVFPLCRSGEDGDSEVKTDHLETSSVMLRIKEIFFYQLFASSEEFHLFWPVSSKSVAAVQQKRLQTVLNSCWGSSDWSELTESIFYTEVIYIKLKFIHLRILPVPRGPPTLKGCGPPPPLSAAMLRFWGGIKKNLCKFQGQKREIIIMNNNNHNKTV